MLNEYFNILQIPHTNDINVIKKSFRQLSLKYHPDKNDNNSDLFNKINNAYEMLSKYISNNNDKSIKLFNKQFDNINSDNLNFDNINSDNLNFDNLNHNILNNNHNNTLNNNIDYNNHRHNYNSYSSLNSNINSNNCVNDIETQVNISYEKAYFGCNLPITINREVINNDIKYYENETIYIEILRGIDDKEIIYIKNKGNYFGRGFKRVR